MNALLQEGIIATKHVLNAGIIRKKDGAIRAQSKGFAISNAELTIIENAFDKPSELRGENVQFSIQEQSYQAVRADKLSIYGKNGKNGVVICKTLHHYLIAIWDQTMYAGVAVEAVEKLADYLRKKDK